MANDRIDYTMEGLPELLGKLDSVTQDIKYKGGRFALRRAAQVIRDQARDNAGKVDRPQTPTNIAANIVERWNGRLFKRTGALGFRVGALGGARQYAGTRENVRKGRVGEYYHVGGDKTNPGGDTFYWRFLEFGTSHSSAQPFMRPAMDKGQEAVNVFINEYGKALDRAIKKAKKRAGK